MKFFWSWNVRNYPLQPPHLFKRVLLHWKFSTSFIIITYSLSPLSSFHIDQLVSTFNMNSTSWKISLIHSPSRTGLLSRSKCWVLYRKAFGMPAMNIKLFLRNIVSLVLLALILRFINSSIDLLWSYLNTADVRSASFSARRRRRRTCRKLFLEFNKTPSNWCKLMMKTCKIFTLVPSIT